MLQLKSEYMLENGKCVDYKMVKDSALFKEYSNELAPQLQYVNLDNITENGKKAFFINIYNTLTIHGLIEQCDLPASVLKVEQFWKTTAYNIGGHVYSLDAIEHGILRANRGHPSSLSPEFNTDDPRMKFVVWQLDPRIHFALVCGAKSCPAINVYSEDNIEAALDAATRNFCAQEVHIMTDVDEIRLSKIFDWYKRDFGQTDIDMINWIIPYLDITVQEHARDMLLKFTTMKKVGIKYNVYDWTLNLYQS